MAHAVTWPSDVDPDDELFAVIAREEERQNTTIQLIASENFTSPAVLRATGSVLTNKYAEGYPGKRYYGGNQHIDESEALAIERAKELFGAEHANVQSTRRQREHGRLPGAAGARRHDPRAVTRPRRAPHARLTGQRQRAALPLRVLQAQPERRTHRPRPGADSPSRTAPDDRCRCNGLSAPHRGRAVPRSPTRSARC